MTRLCPGPWLLPTSCLKAGATQQRHHLGAAEQGQQALELASMGSGGVELEGKSASIKSISDSIQSSNACSLSSCAISLLSRLRSISRSILLRSAPGSRRQLSIDKNEWKRERDEPDAPLLLHGDDASEDVDVVIGGEKGNRSDNNTGNSFKHCRRTNREATRLDLHQWRGHQFTSPNQKPPMIVRAYQWRHQAAAGQVGFDPVEVGCAEACAAPTRTSGSAATMCQTPHGRAIPRPPLTLNAQTDRSKTAERQRGIDGSLRLNLNSGSKASRPDRPPARPSAIHAPAPLHADQGAGPPYPHTRRPAPLSRLSTPPTGTGRAPRPHPRRHKPC